MAMDLVEGTHLQDHLRAEGPMKEPRVQWYTAELAGALDWLHKAGWLYRDVKLTNVMLSLSEGSYGRIKLIDFGFALHALWSDKALGDTANHGSWGDPMRQCAMVQGSGPGMVGIPGLRPHCGFVVPGRGAVRTADGRRPFRTPWRHLVGRFQDAAGADEWPQVAWQCQWGCQRCSILLVSDGSQESTSKLGRPQAVTLFFARLDRPAVARHLRTQLRASRLHHRLSQWGATAAPAGGGHAAVAGGAGSLRELLTLDAREKEKWSLLGWRRSPGILSHL